MEAQLMLRRLFRRRDAYAPDGDALRKILESEPPEGSTNFPDAVNFGWGGAAGHLLGLVVLAVGLIAFEVLLGFGLAFLLILAVSHLLITLASSIPDFASLNTRITVSGRGVDLEKVHRQYGIPWWEARSIYATADLVWLRINGVNERATVNLSGQTKERRASFAQSLRAFGTEHRLEMEEWPRDSRIRRGVLSGSLSLASAAVVVAAVYFYPPGGVAGIRCSVNSGFLQETYGTGDQRGCVVLRVSAGAEKAGIRVGDLIVEMDGVPVTSGQQFSLLFDSDQDWSLKIVRKGTYELLSFHVEPGRRRSFPEDQTDPFFYYLRARWDADAKPENAIRDYTRAIELQPGFDLAYLYRGQLFEHAGQLALAKNDYLRALELSPRLGEAHGIFAAYLDDIDPQAALEHARRAIELDGCEGAFEEWNLDCAGHYLLLAALLGNKGDVNQMLTNAEQSIRYYPGLADPYYYAACALADMANLEAAESRGREYLRFPQSERESFKTDRIERLVADGTGCLASGGVWRRASNSPSARHSRTAPAHLRKRESQVRLEGMSC